MRALDRLRVAATLLTVAWMRLNAGTATHLTVLEVHRIADTYQVANVNYIFADGFEGR